MNFIYLKSLNKIDLLTYFILFLPFSIIIGNSFINSNILIIIILGLFKFHNEITNFSKLNYKFFIIIFFFLITNILTSNQFSLTVIGSLGLIKHLLLFVMLYVWLSNNKSNLKYFFVSTLIAVSLIAISVLFEFIYYFLNNMSPSQYNNRISGLFFEEKVAGSFISKLFGLSILFILFFKKNLKLMLFFSIFVLSSIIISGDRSAIFMIIIVIIILIFFNKELTLLNKIKAFISFNLIILIFFILSENFRSKLMYTSLQLGLLNVTKILFYTDKKFFKKHNTIENFEDYSKYIKIKNFGFLKTKYFAHLSKAYEIGQNNLIFGNGIKSFRKECHNKNYSNKFLESFPENYPADYSCATHPHNIYFEIFSETGLVGLFLFLLILNSYFIKIKQIKSYRLKILVSGILILLFFPIQTTGSFFSTFNGIFYFINLAVILFIFKNQNYIK